MAKLANTTLLADLLDPEVLADNIDSKLIDAVRFAPLAVVDDTLVGRDGDTLSFESYEYIGNAEDVEEGNEIPIAKLTSGVEKVTVSKIGKAVEFSDEALLAGHENTVAEEASKQILKSINDKVEMMFLEQMSTKAALTANISSRTDGAMGVATALQQFGEDLDGETVMICPPSFYGELLASKYWVPNSEANSDIVIRGSLGKVFGSQIIVSNRLVDKTYEVSADSTVQTGKTYYTKKADSYVAVKKPTGNPATNGYYEYKSKSANTAYIVKPGALRLVMKRDTLVEFDRDKLAQLNYIIGSKLFAPYVYDKTKLIKVTL